MYDFLCELLSDKKGGATFSCFGISHLCYLLFFFAIIFLAIMYLKGKDQKTRQKVISLFINCAFVLYMADFFLMPFAYGAIDMEKLPFHICTAMCVMCYMSRHSKFWGKYKLHFALLGFLSNLTYLIYPAGVMWYQVHPLSYRVIQTLLFHSCMSAYGLLALIYDDAKLCWKHCYRDLAVLVCMTLWAILGNTFYNSPSRNYNWFFVVQDPFYMLPQSIAPYLMPILNITIFFAAEMLVYAFYLRKYKNVS